MMKHTFIFISMLCCVALQTQAQIRLSDLPAEVSMAQVLTRSEASGATAENLKIRTTETVVQRHDDVPVYKTIREVEYTVKESEKKISRKRKVLSSTTERLSSDSKMEEIYPDVTAVLMSGVFTPKSVKKNEESFKLPFIFNVDKNQGSTQVVFDKLGAMQSLGMATTDKTMGTQMRYDVITEQLQYGSLSDHLYLDQLKSVQTTFALTTTEKSGSSHRVKVVEDIQVQ